MNQLLVRCRIAFVLILVACSSWTMMPAKDSPLAIEIWYGDVQHFGRLGHPQRWINILGRVTPAKGVSLQYSLNDGPMAPLSLGPDDARLARPGDFNLDLDSAILKNGNNKVVLVARDSSQHRVARTVTVDYHQGSVWPLPYSIDWSRTKSITDVVQVVDGMWKLEGDGVRTVEPYYDRILAFGDVTWTNYTVTAEVTFNGFTLGKKGPPTYGVSHAAIAERWSGHAEDDRQPHVKWYPLGVTAEFRLSEHLDKCFWHIFRDGNFGSPASIDENHGRQVELGVRYKMKVRVDGLPGSAARYRTRFWKDGDPEPVTWDMDSKEGGEYIPSGSVLLIAHNNDVTFGNITAVPNKIEETTSKADTVPK